MGFGASTNKDKGFESSTNKQSHSSKQSKTSAIFNKDTNEISHVFSNCLSDGVLMPARKASSVCVRFCANRFALRLEAVSSETSFGVLIDKDNVSQEVIINDLKM